MNTLDDIRAKCRIDAATRCWVWQGAGASAGVAHVYTIDYARKTKRYAVTPGLWVAVATCG